MTMPAEPWVDVPVERVRIETPKAVLFRIANGNVWIPRSQIVDYSGEEVTVSRWFAEQKGLCRPE